MHKIGLSPIALSEEPDFMNMALQHFVALNDSFKPRPEWERNFFGAYFFDSQTSCMWIMSNDERVGFIIYGLKPHPYNGRQIGYVYETFITRTHRKKGVAAAAADLAIDDMANAGAIRVELEIVPGNVAAENLWTKKGFQPVATRYSRRL
jgi:RimJ/RimL family protein N-acetyltransferase